MAEKVLFPSWRYHATEPAKIIHGPAEEAEGWGTAPVVPPPGDETAIDTAADVKRPRWGRKTRRP